MLADFGPFEAKLEQDKAPALAIALFKHAYEQLASGATGIIYENDIEPVESLPDADDLKSFEDLGARHLDHLAVIKLNGGLGTSMGMEGPKSLLPVKEGKRFIDLIADQICILRERHKARLPLVLMDSFRTQADTAEALAAHPVMQQTVPLSFLQHRVPKIRSSDLQPAEHPQDELTWCPPGHGDIYAALMTSGILRQLVEQGFTHAFVSNADNLGAIPDLGIFGWMIHEETSFIMECADRTPADSKGGHLARCTIGGQLTLREVAQCSPDDAKHFQDIQRHRYFNSNNLWIDLRAIKALIKKRGGALGLPLIRNEKPLDPAHPHDLGATRVFQLESAMGAAISLFPNARAVRVDRSRFLPVKTTNDLLTVASDCYRLDDDSKLVRTRSDLPTVDLDPSFYRTIELFQSHIQQPPSLREATRLKVRGDVHFDTNVIVRGDCDIHHPEGQLTLKDVVLGEV